MIEVIALLIVVSFLLWSIGNKETGNEKKGDDEK